VLEPLAAYLVLAQTLWTDASAAQAWNFGPLPHERATVRTVIDLARTAWPGGQVNYAQHIEGPHEAGWLALDTSLAQTRLGLAPRWNLAESVGRTLRWYRARHEGKPARELCLADLDTWSRVEERAAA
jgi:CDP-glucose 4,6-dehydratase